MIHFASPIIIEDDETWDNFQRRFLGQCVAKSIKFRKCIYQLLDEVEQNIVICRWRADQLLADAEGRGK